MIETENLVLRRPKLDDFERVHEMIRTEEVHRFLGPDHGYEDSFLRAMRNEGCWSFFGYGPFIVRERGSEDFVGQCGLFHSRRGLGEDFDPFPEAGWVIDPNHWGKSYATEAMRSIIDWSKKERGIERIVAIISEGNAASVAIASKLGFSEIGAANYKGDPVMRYAWTASPA